MNTETLYNTKSYLDDIRIYIVPKCPVQNYLLNKTITEIEKYLNTQSSDILYLHKFIHRQVSLHNMWYNKQHPRTNFYIPVIYELLLDLVHYIIDPTDDNHYIIKTYIQLITSDQNLGWY